MSTAGDADDEAEWRQSTHEEKYDDFFPNSPERWQEQSSAWEEHNEEELNDFNALYEATDQGLSAHLYNDFVLGQRPVLQDSEVDPTPEQDIFESNILSLDEEEVNFEDPQRWTAWPLPPDQLMSNGYLMGEGDDDRAHNLPSRGPEKASAALEEIISGAILKLAKEKFSQRQTGSPTPELTDETDNDLETPIIKSRASSEAESSNNVADSDLASDELIFYGDEASSQGSVAVVSSYDGISYDTLRPVTRDILTKLDRTLTILHNSRMTTISETGSSDSQNDLRETENSSSDAENNSQQPASQFRSSRVTAMEATESSDSQNDSWVTDDSSSDSDNDSQQFFSEGSEDEETNQQSVQKESPDLRDWSDVMGAATLAGFSPQVIARASQRCSDLFGQKLSLRTLTEEPVISHDSGPSREKDRPKDGSRPSSRDGQFYCQVEGCDRSSKPFRRKYHLSRHIQLIHQDIIEMTNSKIEKHMSEGGERQDEIDGAVSQDAFLQPIGTSGWRSDDKKPRAAKGSKGKQT